MKLPILFLSVFFLAGYLSAAQININIEPNRPQKALDILNAFCEANEYAGDGSLADKIAFTKAKTAEFLIGPYLGTQVFINVSSYTVTTRNAIRGDIIVQ